MAFELAALPDGYYTLGLTEAIATPAYGVEVVKEGDSLNWTVDYEDGVVSYRIEKKIGESWNTVTAVAATGEVNSTYSVVVGEGEFRIVAIDASGFSQTFGVTDANVVDCFIDIKSGWNLISVPCENADLASLKSLGTLWCWDGKGYVEVEEPQAMQGLWIFTDAATELNLKGNCIENANVNLTSGWNLVGPAANCQLPEGLTAFTWDGAYNALLNDGKGLITGQGYWIYSDNGQAVELR